jgi:crotonobetainyl-CoA:carnitine CoA-transferase CaiB-like acyl-CoA transferase
MRCPSEWSETTGGDPPPSAARPGEHSEEILGELGYSREEISALFDKRVIPDRLRRRRATRRGVPRE